MTVTFLFIPSFSFVSPQEHKLHGHRNSAVLPTATPVLKLCLAHRTCGWMALVTATVDCNFPQQFSDTHMRNWRKWMAGIIQLMGLPAAAVDFVQQARMLKALAKEH